MSEIFNNIFAIVIGGGAFYAIFYFIRNAWYGQEKKKQKIVTVILIILIVILIIIALFQNILFEPNMRSDLRNIAQQSVETLRLYLNEDIPVNTARDIFAIYIDEYKRLHKETETEKEVFETMVLIYDELDWTYLGEMAITDDYGNIIGEDKPYFFDKDDYGTNYIESLYNILSKQLKNRYDSEKIITAK